MTVKTAGRRPSARARQAAAPASAEEFMRAFNAKDFAKAKRIVEALLEREPSWTDAQIAYAQLLYQQYGETDRPLEILTDVRAREPDLPLPLTLFATIHSSLGQTEEAVAYARRCVEVSPETPDSYLAIHRAHPEEGPALAEAIERVLGERAPNDRQRVTFHGILGRIADRAGDIDRAFAAFTRSKSILPNRYDREQMERHAAEMARVFDAELIASKARFGLGDQKPTFILGMPRSGSTLLERIVSAHPNVDTAGERTELAKIGLDLRRAMGAPAIGLPGDCDFFAALSKSQIRAAANAYLAGVRPALANPNALRWIDKMPGNFMLVGFIKMLMPKASVIHARRNPLDVALSCYTQSFFEGHDYSQDLASLGHYIAVQRRMMAHWDRAAPQAVLEVRYEDVVADLERQARRALDHLGLPWNEACLSPQDSERAVLTASIDQVRKPIYDSSIGKWRRYERHLAPVLDAWRAMGGETLDALIAETDIEEADS